MPTAESDLLAFVLARTAEGQAPLCPELRLRLGHAVMPLWEATQALLGPEAPPPYWAFAWPGGQALARCLLDGKVNVEARQVLDFGAGCGLQSLAARRAGAREVIAAEIDPLGRVAIASNAALNGLFIEVADRDLIDADDGWDVVLAGDVSYEQPMAGRVEAWLRGLACRGATVLLGDTRRRYTPTDGMEAIATFVVPTSRDLEGREACRATVWRMLAL